LERLVEGKGRLPKLLSPIKTFRGAVRVIGAGADEIYCGVKIPGFGDFELYRGSGTQVTTYEELGKIVEYAHTHGVRVLVTVNQPFMIDELEKHLKSHIESCVETGVDGLIIGDLGVLSLAKDMNGEVELIASTYLSALNKDTVAFLKEAGFDRVILERQVSIDDITDIVKSTDIRIEVFIHGSGCSNINVNCYLYHFKFPEMDRGLLTIDGIKFPCALPFEVYDISSQERLGVLPVVDAYTFCSLCRLPELINSGVYGLKIEGRGINEDYQESTTRLYRESINMILDGRGEEYMDWISTIKDSFVPLPRDLPLTNLRELCCEQGRCYYSPLLHAPYREPLSWKTWTKLQYKLLVIPR